jgi:hypothetical protein
LRRRKAPMKERIPAATAGIMNAQKPGAAWGECVKKW